VRDGSRCEDRSRSLHAPEHAVGHGRPLVTASRPLGGTSDRSAWGPGLLESIWRFLWLVVALAVVGAVLGYWAVGRQPDRYRATSRLHLAAQPRSGLFGESTKTDPERRLLDQTERITSKPVLERAAEILPGRASGSALADSVSANVATDLDVITVHASDRSPTRAAAIANAVVEAYEEHTVFARVATAQTAIEKLNEYRGSLEAKLAETDAQMEERRRVAEAAVVAEQGAIESGSRLRAVDQRLRLDRRYRDLEVTRNATFTQLTAMQNRADQLAVDAAAAASDVELVETASAPKTPVGADAERGALVGGALGLLAGAAVAWTRAERRQRMAPAGGADAILAVPCLGEVPEDRSLRGSADRVKPWSPAAEAFNFVVAALTPALAKPGRKTWLVTSPRAGDGKTTTTLNLAIAAQKRGHRVMVIDADLRSRGLTLLSGGADHGGLTEVAAGHVPVARCTVKLDGSRNGSSPLVVPTGALPDDPAVFFGSDGFGRALARIEDEVDVVLIDAPSLLVVADARAIAEQVTGTIVVTTPDMPTEALETTAQVLRWTSTPVLGYVRNRGPRRRGSIPTPPEVRTGRRGSRRSQRRLPRARRARAAWGS